MIVFQNGRFLSAWSWMNPKKETEKKIKINEKMYRWWSSAVADIDMFCRSDDGFYAKSLHAFHEGQKHP